jgi:predicted phosphodiesterase
MAFLADIHGNLAALRAVLAEVAERNIETIFVAGDLLFGGEHPLEVWRLLEQVSARCIRGVSDDALIHIDPIRLAPVDDRERARAALFAATRAGIGDLIVQQLRSLPATIRIPLLDGTEIVLCHGSPSDPTAEMGADLTDDELNALVADDPADFVVCGASHVPFERNLGHVYIVNVGSVGESTDPGVAQFTVFDPRIDGALIEQAWVGY